MESNGYDEDYMKYLDKLARTEKAMEGIVWWQRQMQWDGVVVLSLDSGSAVNTPPPADHPAADQEENDEARFNGE